MSKEPCWTPKIAIYGILDRRTKTGYIGQTNRLVPRCGEHLQAALCRRKQFWRLGLNGLPKKAEWLLHAAKRGVELRVLAVVSSRGLAAEKEREFMERARAKGWSLLNESSVTTVPQGAKPKSLTRLSLSSALSSDPADT